MRFISVGLLFIALFIGAIIAYLPLKFVVDLSALKSKGVYYDRVVGTVWDGGLSDVHIAGEAIGQLNISLKPLSILKLKPELAFEFAGAVGSGKGLMAFGLDKSITVRDVLGNIQLNAVKHLDMQLRRSPSKLNLSIRHLKTNAEGQCLDASGHLTSDILSAVGRSWGWDGPEMDGSILCEGEHFLVDMKNKSGIDQLQARGLFRSDLSYDVESHVKTQDVRLSNALISFGFVAQPEQGAYLYSKTAIAQASAPAS
ncbi:type II secretion system protein N [Hirschia litorea]|uniref:Type II secretion system protein N n=1 Tax=Hirschia litorea TaxID=1199156 RepID=A0ABW2IGX6_9PROT